jgi:hypothetical protein
MITGMANMFSAAPRFRTFALLVLFGLIGHFAQLISEDRFWDAEYRTAMWISPGWHLEMNPVISLAIAVLLVFAVFSGIVLRKRFILGIVAVFYILHFFSYPFRIRNHMTFMLATQGFLLVSLLVTRTLRTKANDLRHSSTALIDNQICTGLAWILVINYFFAGFHKLNTAFFSFDSSVSVGAGTIEGFLGAGQISYYAPHWLLALVLPGAIVCEMVLPTLIWRSDSFREVFILIMLAFHFPMVTTLGAADYPMIVIAFYPVLFSETRWSTFEHELLKRWNWVNVVGAFVGIAAHWWFTPDWTPNTAYGIFVAGLWGFAAVTLAKCFIARLARQSVVQPQTAYTNETYVAQRDSHR